MYKLQVFASLLPLLLQSSLVSGQSAIATSAPSISASATSSREPITRTIAVAKGGHTFVPDVTQAEVGDFIEFRFYPTNHSVIRAPYKYPCVPFELLETDKVGFSSGFKPVDAILNNPPKWTIRINDTDPIFYYCSAPGSCINYAMVGVINPNASTSLEVQKDDAHKSSFMLQPGQSWPDEANPPGGSSSSSSTSSTASPTTSATSAPAATTSAAAVPVPHKASLSSGAIAGIAIGGAAVALMAAVLVYLCGRNRALSDVIRPRRHSTATGDFEGNGVQYVQGVPKHMSGMTMISRPESTAYMPHSSALPGYAGQHDHVHSPPRTQYAASDALSPATPIVRSVSPGSGVVPAYTQSPPLPSQTPVEHGAEGPHEMDGGPGHYRRSSMQKGGVERYT